MAVVWGIVQMTEITMVNESIRILGLDEQTIKAIRTVRRLDKNNEYASKSRNKAKAEHEAMCAKVETLTMDMDRLKENLKKSEANLKKAEKKNIALTTRLQNIVQFAQEKNIYLPN